MEFFLKKKKKAYHFFFRREEMLKNGVKVQNRDRMSLQTGNTISG